MTIDVGKSDRLAVTVLLGFISLVGCVLERPAPIAEEDALARDATEPLDGGTPSADKELPSTKPEGDGGSKAGPAACTVSFAKDVLPAFEAAGCDATQCHGTRLARAVRIEVKDVELTYAELTQFTLGGKPYVKVGSTDVDASTIHCHLAGKCGVKMPPAGGAVPPALVQAVDRWLACGAPKN